MTERFDVAARLDAVRARLEAAAVRAGRSAAEIALVGVSKRHGPERIAAAVSAGLRDVAESYVQEAVGKIPVVLAELARLGVAPPRWHFVGRLQRNKARDAVRWFDCISSVDRESLGDELQRRAQSRDRRLDVLLQVDVSGEPQKGGVAPDGLPGLLAASARWTQLRVVGLMAIPAMSDDREERRPAFARLRGLRDAMQREPGGEHLTELSMGMSDDFEIAIEEGATIVRVGTAIFGPRSPA